MKYEPDISNIAAHDSEFRSRPSLVSDCRLRLSMNHRLVTLNCRRERKYVS